MAKGKKFKVHKAPRTLIDSGFKWNIHRQAMQLTVTVAGRAELEMTIPPENFAKYDKYSKLFDAVASTAYTAGQQSRNAEIASIVEARKKAEDRWNTLNEKVQAAGRILGIDCDCY